MAPFPETNWSGILFCLEDRRATGGKGCHHMLLPSHFWWREARRGAGRVLLMKHPFLIQVLPVSDPRTMHRKHEVLCTGAQHVHLRERAQVAKTVQQAGCTG